jgi:hypothetical protein
MGMFDEVWFDEELPDFPAKCRRFQTKSLHRLLDRYTVTKAGRLLLQGNVLQDDSLVPATPRGRESSDTNFHGDLRLITDEGEFEEYIARFTHGTLEWIRPSADVPEF